MHASLYVHWDKSDIARNHITEKLGPSASIADAFKNSFFANATELIPSADYAHLLPEHVMILFPNGIQAMQVHVELRSSRADLNALRERIRQVYVLLKETIVQCGGKIDVLTVIIEAGVAISSGKLNTRGQVAWDTIRKTYIKDLCVGLATIATSYYLKQSLNLSAMIGFGTAIIAMLASIIDALRKFEPIRYETE